MMRISLIIPLYNAEKYLRACLDSVQAQTFRDFECLCINDGSVDGTADIVAAYARGDRRFILTTKENAGCSEARNTGLRQARGTYIAFLDQDDILHPQALEALFYLIEKYGTDVSAFSYRLISDHYRLENAPRYDISSLSVSHFHQPFRDFFHMGEGGAVEIWIRLYRKDAIEGIYFPAGIQPGEDTVFTLKVMHRIKSMVSVAEPFLFYRFGNESSVMTRGITKSYISAIVDVSEHLHQYFLAEGRAGADMRDAVARYLSRSLYFICCFHVLRLRPSSRRREMTAHARPLLEDMYRKNIFRPDLFVRKERAVSLLYLNGKIFLARLILALGIRHKGYRRRGLVLWCGIRSYLRF